MRARLFAARALATAVATVAALGPAAGAEDVPSESASGQEDGERDVRLDVQVTERGPFRPWRLKVTNVSDEPVSVAADPRLLSFDVTVPGEKEPQHCKLPSSMMPSSVTDKAVRILEPGRFVLRRVDPRFFCFSEGEQDVLVPGAEVTPTFGWPTKTKTKWRRGRRIEEPLPPAPPWVAEPVLEDTELSPLKNVKGTPVTLGPDYAVRKYSDDKK